MTTALTPNRYDHTLIREHAAAAVFHIDQLEADIERLRNIANGEIGSEMNEDDYLTLRIYHYLNFSDSDESLKSDPAIKPDDYNYISHLL